MKYQQSLYKMKIFHLFLGIILTFLPLAARADHVLLQDGRALFNVLVENTNTTWSRPLRIRHKPASFGYDYKTNSAIALPGFANYYHIADFITTSAEVGKDEARAIMEERRWTQYRRPPRAILTPIVTPSHRTTTTLTKLVPIDPARLADASLPVGDRVAAQLTIFKNEQTALVNKILFGLASKTIKPKEVQQLKLDLLNSQYVILTQTYTSGVSEVDKAREALTSEITSVKQTGNFTWEN